MISRVTVEIEVDEEYVDHGNETGLTEEGYVLLTNALTSSVASSIVDITATHL